MANGIRMVSEKVRGLKSGKMAANILVIGKTIKQTVKADLYMLTVTCTKEIGLQTKLMVEASMNISTVQNTSETGKKTGKMDTVLKPGLTTQNMKGLMKMERNTVLELSNGQTNQFI